MCGDCVCRPPSGRSIPGGLDFGSRIFHPRYFTERGAHLILLLLHFLYHRSTVRNATFFENDRNFLQNFLLPPFPQLLKKKLKKSCRPQGTMWLTEYRPLTTNQSIEKARRQTRDGRQDARKDRDQSTTHIERLTRKSSRMPASLDRRSGRWLGSVSVR